MFTSIDAAVRGLLLTTCGILNNAGTRYVVAGGWVPFLRGGDTELAHPGTRDVDVLFGGNLDEIGRAIRVLMTNGFKPSGKHEFQLLLPIQIMQSEFIFNVDLMHPLEQQRKPGLFADIFELGVDDAYDPTGRRWAKSIVFTGAEVVFNERLWSEVDVTGADAHGTQVAVSVPLLDEVALVLSKASSVKNEKRTRDAFDIYYVLHGPRRNQIVSRLLELAKKYQPIKMQLNELIEWISEDPDKFDSNVDQFTAGRISDAAKQVVGLLKEDRTGPQ